MRFFEGRAFPAALYFFRPAARATSDQRLSSLRTNGPECIRPAAERIEALLMQRRDGVRRFHGLAHGGGKLVDDRLRCPGRRHQAEPDAGIEIGHAGFRHRRQVGQNAWTRTCRRCERCELAGRDLAEHGGSRRKHHHGAAGDEIGDRLRTALIRHVDELDAGALREQFGREMRRGADARRGIKHLARLLLGECDQLRDGVHVRCRIDDQHDGGGRDEADRRKILRHVEREIGIDRLIGDVGGRPEKQCVAVIGRVGRIVGRNARTGARLVFDHELLAEELPHAIAEDARRDVGSRARREADNEMDGT